MVTTSKDIHPNSKVMEAILNNKVVTTVKALCSTLNKDIPLSNISNEVTIAEVAPAPVEFAPVLWLHSHAAAAWIFSSKKSEMISYL